MIESLRDDLDAHHNAPDKIPERRLATLDTAGQLAIPFTTGILVGIGETEVDRIAALDAIAASHRTHGHIQEVIVQNFLPKQGTSMWKHAACPTEDFLRAIALARVILPPEVHLQAPPNLSDDFGKLLDAGIDDWGGVSPITADHVNPERPWPELDRIRHVTEAHGFTLAPRLTIYPEYCLDPDRWLHEDLRFPVMDRSDAEGLGRDDPGAIFPERAEFIASGLDTDGSEVVLTGERSTQWYSGSPAPPPHVISARVAPTPPIRDVLNGIEAGDKPGFDELVALFAARGSDVGHVAQAADRMRFELVGDAVSFVKNRNINYTNVCTFKCRFCGFSKGPMSLNLRGTPYLLTLEQMQERVVEAVELGATEVCLQGGIHPDFDGEYYIDVTRAVRAVAPDIHIHGFTALEVTEGAKRLGEPLESYLTRLMEAGQKSLPGTAAEILDDDVREILCPDKINTEEWLHAHRIAHKVGLHSNVTMMFGAVEQPESWVRHLLITRDLQEQTGGFTEFVGLPFVHMAAPLYLRKMARRGPTFRETLLIHAVARLAYGPLIRNIQASWVKIGLDGVRQMLQAGCNDLGGTLMNENISRAAGAAHGQSLTAEDFTALVEPLGRTLVQRTTDYQIV
jgi:FO synthase